MKLRVVALGHRMPAWVDAGWDDYAKRLPREFALELVELKPEPRDRGKTVGADACRRSRAHRAPPATGATSSRSTSAAARGPRASSPITSRAGATTRTTSRSSSAAPTGSTRRVKRDARRASRAVRADAAARTRARAARRAALSRREPARRPPVSSRVSLPPRSMPARMRTARLPRVEEPAPAGAAAPARRRVRRCCGCAKRRAASATSSKSAHDGEPRAALRRAHRAHQGHGRLEAHAAAQAAAAPGARRRHRGRARRHDLRQAARCRRRARMLTRALRTHARGADRGRAALAGRQPKSRCRVVDGHVARAFGAARSSATSPPAKPSTRPARYAIQGRAAAFITRIDGSYSGVMGLPLVETAALLARIGFPVL